MRCAAIQEYESQLFAEHLAPVTEAVPTIAPAPAAPDPTKLRANLERELGVTELAAALDSYGEPPLAPAPPAIDVDVIERQLWADAESDVPAWRLGARHTLYAKIATKAQELAAAREMEQEAERARLQGRLDEQCSQLQTLRQRVERQVAEWVEAETARLDTARAREQEVVDLHWRRLTDGDPDTTLNALRAAFDDSSVTALGCVENTAVLVVPVAEQDELIGDEEPTYAQAGRPTVRMRSQTRMNDLYVAAMASEILAAGRRAMAAAPGIDWVYCIAIVPVENDEEWEPVYAGTFTREYLLTVDGIPNRPEPLVSALDIPEDAVWGLVGRTRELGTIDTDEDPALAAVVRQMRRDVRSDPAAAAAGDAAAVHDLFLDDDQDSSPAYELGAWSAADSPAPDEVSGYPELELFLHARDNDGQVVLSRHDLLGRFAGTYDDMEDLDELLTDTGFRLASPLTSSDSNDPVEVTLKDPPLTFQLRYTVDKGGITTVAIADLLEDLGRQRLTCRARDEILNALNDVDLTCDKAALDSAHIDGQLELHRAPEPTSA